MKTVCIYKWIMVGWLVSWMLMPLTTSADTLRNGSHAGLKESDASQLIINEIQVSNLDMFLDVSENYGSWMEFYNPTGEDIQLDGCYLSDRYDNLRQYQILNGTTVPAGGFAVLYFGHSASDPCQANFDLDMDGGTLYVSHADGSLFMEQDYPESITRASWARTTDGGTSWGYTADPTPGASNATSTFAAERLPAPTVNRESCIHTNSFNFSVSGIPAGCTLRYTTDGSVPTLTNGTATASRRFAVGKKTIIFRFRVFGDGYLPSPVVTRSYIYSERAFSLPVVSIVTDDRFLYGDSLGIMVRGKNGIIGFGQNSPCNWNRNWDRVASLQYILPDGSVVADQEGTISVSGGWTRSNTPHSFKFKADKTCEGLNSVDYKFFSDKPHLKHKTLYFRSGGSDTSCRLKDPALQVIIQTSGMDVDCQAYQPTVHFINGEYKGLINLREPSNKQFVRANYNLDPEDEMDLFEMGRGDYVGHAVCPIVGYQQMCGTKDAMNELRTYSKKCTDPEAYQEVCRRLDMDEFINYMALELFLANGDWVNYKNNMRGWRPRTDDGRFRMILYDLDAAFGLPDNFNNYFANYFMIQNVRTGAPEEFDICCLFRDLCNNASFRKQFIDTYCLVAGSVFEPTRVFSVVDSLAANIKDMLAYEGKTPYSTANALKNELGGAYPSTMMSKMVHFAPLRMTGMPEMYGGLRADHHGVRLFVNNIPVPTDRFFGTFYGSITVRAEVPAGLRFVGWRDTRSAKGSYLTKSTVYKIPEGSSFSLIACTEADVDAKVVPVRINEISAANDMYVTEHFKHSDWLELYNASAKAVDVAGMTLTVYSSPTEGKAVASTVISAPYPSVSTVILPHDHLIIWCDKDEAVSELHAPFRLDVDSGMVVLTAADSTWADTLAYVPHGDCQSVGLFPDGGTCSYTFPYPTIGYPNRMSSYALNYDEQTIRDIYTGVENVIVAESEIPAVVEGIFDLTGRRVTNPTSGIYIINGKKVLVK